MAQSKQSRVARLMLKAVRSLPEKEQQIVLEYLVESGLGATRGAPTPTEAPLPPGAKERAELVLRSQRAIFGAIRPGVDFDPVWGGPLGPDQQMIPVRLSGSQHRLLKDWCAENGFSMAVVVRGLVERFLEDQERRAA